MELELLVCYVQAARLVHGVQEREAHPVPAALWTPAMRPTPLRTRCRVAVTSFWRGQSVVALEAVWRYSVEEKSIVSWVGMLLSFFSLFLGHCWYYHLK